MSERFSEAVCQELENYVYRLVDPRNGETFYVGKGSGNRVFDHVAAALKFDPEEDEMSAKYARIKAIQSSGLEVLHVIHRHRIPKSAIYDVEAALIDCYPGLTNAQAGHGSNDRGPMHAKQIIDKYSLPVIDWPPVHKLILININRLEKFGRDDIYRQVRFAWRLDPKKAGQEDFVLAVVRGVVVGAFEAEYWKAATIENFPDKPFDEPKRLAFKGHPAPDDIWDLYVGERGKRIALDGLRHVQYPIRHWAGEKP